MIMMKVLACKGYVLEVDVLNVLVARHSRKEGKSAPGASNLG